MDRHVALEAVAVLASRQPELTRGAAAQALGVGERHSIDLEGHVDLGSGRGEADRSGRAQGAIADGPARLEHEGPSLRLERTRQTVDHDRRLSQDRAGVLEARPSLERQVVAFPTNRQIQATRTREQELASQQRVEEGEVGVAGEVQLTSPPGTPGPVHPEVSPVSAQAKAVEGELPPLEAPACGLLQDQLPLARVDRPARDLAFGLDRAPSQRGGPYPGRHVQRGDQPRVVGLCRQQHAGIEPVQLELERLDPLRAGADGEGPLGGERATGGPDAGPRERQHPLANRGRELHLLQRHPSEAPAALDAHLAAEIELGKPPPDPEVDGGLPLELRVGQEEGQLGQAEVSAQRQGRGSVNGEPDVPVGSHPGVAGHKVETTDGGHPRVAGNHERPRGGAARTQVGSELVDANLVARFAELTQRHVERRLPGEGERGLGPGQRRERAEDTGQGQGRELQVEVERPLLLEGDASREQ